MSLPSHAQVVVIGSGIIGCSVAMYRLIHRTPYFMLLEPLPR
jgi:L-2-hydroxyglutarate oxidase LhgO